MDITIVDQRVPLQPYQLKHAALSALAAASKESDASSQDVESEESDDGESEDGESEGGAEVELEQLLQRLRKEEEENAGNEEEFSVSFSSDSKTEQSTEEGSEEQGELDESVAEMLFDNDVVQRLTPPSRASPRSRASPPPPPSPPKARIKKASPSKPPSRSVTTTGLLIDLELKQRRLNRFLHRIERSAHFDQNDIDLVTAEIEETSSAIKMLTNSVSRKEMPFVEMQKTLRYRELLIEEAVKEGLIEVHKDNVFSELVKKQVYLMNLAGQ